MNHEEAVREMSVERYLLGELTGDARNVFEEHLFECPRCTADLKSGVVWMEGTRRELAANAQEGTVRRGWLAWLVSPAWMVPALAACLAFIVYQGAFVVPGLHKQLAEAKAPEVLNTLALAGGQARSGETPTISAPAHGSFLLSVDIPTGDTYSSYICSLYSPSGKLVWSGPVTPDQAKDAVQIQVPAAVTEAGENTLQVQGVLRDSGGAKMDILAIHKFTLELTH